MRVRILIQLAIHFRWQKYFSPSLLSLSLFLSLSVCVSVASELAPKTSFPSILPDKIFQRHRQKPHPRNKFKHDGPLIMHFPTLILALLMFGLSFTAAVEYYDTTDPTGSKQGI